MKVSMYFNFYGYELVAYVSVSCGHIILTWWFLGCGCW